MGLEVVFSPVVRCLPSERTQNRGSAASVLAFSRGGVAGPRRVGRWSRRCCGAEESGALVEKVAPLAEKALNANAQRSDAG